MFCEIWNEEIDTGNNALNLCRGGFWEIFMEVQRSVVQGSFETFQRSWLKSFRREKAFEKPHVRAPNRGPRLLERGSDFLLERPTVMGLKQGFTQVHEPCVEPWEQVAVFQAGSYLRRAW